MSKMTTVRLPVKAGASRGFQGFIGWLEATHPKLYNYALAADPDFVTGASNARSSGAVLSGLGLVDVSPASTLQPQTSGGSTSAQNFVNTLLQAGAAILPLVQQQKILAIQLKRAQAGQAPLDVGDYIDPNSGINVGVTAGTQKTLLYLAGGLGAVFLLSRLMKR
jgi:hypothetical protein